VLQGPWEALGVPSKSGGLCTPQGFLGASRAARGLRVFWVTMGPQEPWGHMSQRGLRILGGPKVTVGSMGSLWEPHMKGARGMGGDGSGGAGAASSPVFHGVPAVSLK
jgi:hypothetical protein